MPGAGIALAGWASAARIFRELAEAIDAEPTTWWVVVGANYGKAVHDGTRRMPARPFLQRALFRVGRKFRPQGAQLRSVGKRTSGRAVWAIMAGDKALAAQIAFEVETEAKREAPLDTGNLRATTVAAPTPAKALVEAKRRAIDPSTVG